MIKTKHSTKPTQFLRWFTMETNVGVRLYRVLNILEYEDETSVYCIYIGKLLYGEFIPFLGTTKPKWKIINKYTSFCTLVNKTASW